MTRLILKLFVASFLCQFANNGIAAFGQDTTVTPLFDSSTHLEPEIIFETEEALVSRIADRVRDRHAREAQFNAYDHYLSFYWEERTVVLEFVDKVAKGGDEIVIHIESLAALNEPNFRCFFRGQNTVAEYHENLIAKPVGKNQYRVTLKNHPVAKRPLRLGDEIEFEFSPFLLSPKNGRSNYYGTTMLYVVGKGIVPWQADGERLDSSPLLDTVRLGGETTLSYQYSDEPSERFKQLAGNIAPASAQAFMRGRRLHHTDMLTGAHSESGNPIFESQEGKLGPGFVAKSCVQCHVNNGRAMPPSPGKLMQQSVVKIANDRQGTPHESLGQTLQPQTTEGEPEARIAIDRWETVAGEYADGTTYSLRKPIYRFEGSTPEFASVRLTPQLVGMGLLEAISETDILALADEHDQNGDGISGRPHLVSDWESNATRLGRFGYKASVPSVRFQIISALHHDMGISTSVSLDSFLKEQSRVDDSPEISDAELSDLVRYVSVLGVSAQRSPHEPDVIRGRELFENANCSSCHTPAFRTGPYHPFAELRNQDIQPYSDLLLHDMGEGLADNLGEANASGAEWRTAPLWSIGLTQGVSQGEAYLHDGRARTLSEAILWHGGEAENSKEVFRNMPQADRECLIEFLKSL